jgi:hypothetical protein
MDDVTTIKDVLCAFYVCGVAGNEMSNICLLAYVLIGRRDKSDLDETFAIALPHSLDALSLHFNELAKNKKTSNAWRKK